MRAGTGSAKLLCIGDSTTLGVGASVQTSYPFRLTEMLNSYYAPTVNGLAIPNNPATVTDSRWTLGTGWSYPATVAWGGFASFTALTSASGNLVFNPGATVDTMDIYFTRNVTLGTTVATINGTPTNIVQSGSAAMAKQTITFASGTHTVSFAPPTGAAVHIVGVDAYLSTDRKIRVGNAGVGSSRSGGWATTGSVFNSINSIIAYAPDLTICMLGINDATDSITAQAHQTNILALATAAKTSGDFIVMSVVPSGDAPKIPFEETYRNVVRSLAISQGWPMVDIYRRHSDYTTANALGFMTDTLHPNAKGYADVARAVFTAVTAV